MREKTKQLIAPQEWELPIDLDRMPTQSAFIHDFQHRFQCYGGGLANGKTTAGCVKAWMYSYLFPGNTGFMGRLDGKEFRQTTFAEFKRMIPESFIAKRNDQLGYLKFKAQYGGSEIIYGDLKEDRFNNINLGFFYIDQCEEVDATRWNLLVSRLRKQTPLIGDDDIPLTANGQPLYAPTYGYGTFNPEGTGSYIWQYFHPDSPARVCTCAHSTICLLHDYKLYQATTYDGLAAGFVSPEYVDGMLAVFPPEARKRYLDGSWDIFSGRIYPGFSREDHVLDYVQVEPHWTLYESIDHGFKNPTAVGWWAVDEFGNRYLVDEHYEGDGRPIKHHAEVIKAKRSQFKQPVAYTYLDSACWAANQSKGDSVYAIVDEYRENGIHCLPGQKDWGTAYSRITQGLTIDPNHVHPMTGALGAPRIFIAPHCEHFIKEALGYRWKKNRITALKNEPEQPMDYNDHHMDEWSYFEASRPIGPVIEQKRIKSALEILKEHKDSKLRHWFFNDEDSESGTWMSH